MQIDERRVIGDVGSAGAGPTLLFIGGIHGNEPAGVIALERVIPVLRRLPVRGRVVALRGNLPALARSVRYVDRDLNRGWTTERLTSPSHALAENREREELARAAVASSGRAVAEDREQHELVRAMLAVEEQARALVVVDLHSTSGPSAPFACVASDDGTASIAGALSIPILAGLERLIAGTLLSWVQARRIAGLSIEGGQNDAPVTAANLLAACWILLVHVGVVAAADAPDLAEHRARMAAAGAGLPRAIVVEHRHRVAPDDDFVMEPGLATFDPVVAGQRLAHDRHGPVLAPWSGRILMPRYQGLGEDGFFLGRDFTPAWLTA